MLKEAIFHLAVACAPNVAPETIDQIIRVESDYQEFAVNINGDYPNVVATTDLVSALDVVQDALSKGYSADIGLMQINTRNLPRLGLSIVEVFDPCINISAGAAILTEYYEKAAAVMGPGQDALLSALSSYNTGSPIRGFTNGYIDRYVAGARYQFVRTGLPGDSSDPAYKQALASDTSVPIPEYMQLEQLTMSEAKQPETQLPNAQDIRLDAERVLKDAEVKGVALRQDIADELGVFTETAVNADDINEGEPVVGGDEADR